ncbi:biotin/lipoyl-containing protein, partial [Nonomuraea angiospora]|uniref:biotin/lipoyl-containing protein n=1 Tax=Nonomuraea angiospora TaxID=46172 RepID=UPI0029B64D87
MTRHVFRLPDLGEGLTEAEIVDWKVSVGDTVEIDQIVVEVETAKAAVEVPVPYAGTVLSLHAPAGTVLSVGEPLIEVGPTGGAGGSAAAERYREERGPDPGFPVDGSQPSAQPLAKVADLRFQVEPVPSGPLTPSDLPTDLTWYIFVGART